jgi:quercetin dioxygenase-like cupin family protein
MTSPPEGYRVPPGAGDPLNYIGLLKASASQTNGSFELIEYRGPASPPVHIHRDREEAFYILEGSFTFTLGSQVFEAGEGSTVVVPRGTPHGFQVGPGGRALLVVSPAGLGGFFKELGQAIADGKSASEIRASLANRYDSHPVGDGAPDGTLFKPGL